jgi:AraC-like DNA-binding protein
METPMHYVKIIPPSDLLKEFVRYFMLFRSNIPNDLKPIEFPLPPSPENFLCFYGENAAELYNSISKSKEKQSNSVIVGPNDKLFQIKLPHRTFLIRVILQQGVLSRILKMPLTELIDIDTFDSNYILPDMRKVNDRLSFDLSDMEAIGVIENYLNEKFQKASKPLAIDTALNQLIQFEGRIRVDDLAKISNLSNRQLERQCLYRTGYTPKYIARMVRFVKAWNLKEKYPELSWTNVAYQCDYSDQAHLIKDFKQFSGINPKQSQFHFNNLPLDLQNDLLFER